MKNVLNALPVGILVIDRDFRIQYANATAREQFGLDFETPISVSRLTRLSPVYIGDVPHPPSSHALDTAFSGKTVHVDSFFLESKSGRKEYESRFSPVFSETGGVEDVVLTIQERSENTFQRKRMRDLMLKSQESAAEYTSDAGRADSRRLAANVSHELRSPLTAIIGFAQELSMSAGLTADERRKMGYILDSGQHLLTVVTGMIDLARAEIQQSQACVTLVDVQRNVEWLHETFQARTRGLEFVVQVAPETPEDIRCDRTRLRQILVNLLDNAFKMTDKGSVKLLVKPTSGGQAVQFDVIDTGPGISDETMSRLFSPFSQGRQGSSRGGLGLGLSVAKSSAESMHGTLDVESTVGVGTRFSLIIPVDAASVNGTRLGAGADLIHEAQEVIDCAPIAAIREFAQLRSSDFNDLRQAAEVCEPDQILALSDKIEGRLPNLCCYLRSVVERFAYEELSEAAQHGWEHAETHSAVLNGESVNG